MILLVIITFLFTKIDQQASSQSLSQLRRLYGLSALQKADSDSLSIFVEHITNTDMPVYICYKGAAKMMQAKYAINPINKFTLFKSGKELIENAIHTDTTSIEMRYLRLTLQSNLPAMLGYNSNVLADKQYLQTNVQVEEDEELKGIISAYLSKLK